MGGLPSKVSSSAHESIEAIRRILPSKVNNVIHETIRAIQRIPPRRKRIYTLVIVAGVIGVPLIFSWVGFTPAGVAASSAAAGWHASIGNVAAGSLFAILQSLGTKTLLLSLIGGLLGSAGCALHSLWIYFWGNSGNAANPFNGDDETPFNGGAETPLLVWVPEK